MAKDSANGHEVEGGYARRRICQRSLEHKRKYAQNDHSQKGDDFGGAKKVLEPRLRWSLVVFLMVEI